MASDEGGLYDGGAGGGLGGVDTEACRIGRGWRGGLRRDKRDEGEEREEEDAERVTVSGTEHAHGEGECEDGGRGGGMAGRARGGTKKR